MHPAQHLILTDIALKAARDCKSKKPARRLKSAMNAVLDFDKNADEETSLMASVAGTIRVVGDIAADAIQRELYGLGRISSLMQATPEGEAPSEEIMAEIERDMPPVSERLSILVLWEQCRVKHGLLREIAMPGDVTDASEDWKTDGEKNSENSS